MTILEAAAALRAKKVSSVELVRDALEKIRILNPRINAFLTVTGEAALVRAAAMDAERARGIDRGPLHGVPIAHKDLILTKGVRTTAGSKIFADFVPDHDAAVVEKLDGAGAVMVGKTGLHELAYGITSNNPHFGPVRNPWDPDRIPGGSSGGSGAAVAAGIVPMATGSDTGGSIRIPSSFCGTVGLKPTYGRVSRYGALPLGWSLDHVGGLATTVRDVAVTTQVLAGYDPRDEFSSRRPVPELAPPPEVSLKGVRVGLPENFYLERVDRQVESAVRAAFQTAAALGAEIVAVRVPDIDALNTVGRVILLAEATAALGPYLNRRQDFGADVLALLDQGKLVPATDYLDAQRLRRLMVREFAKIWQQVDCLFTPATPTPAPRIGQTAMQVGPAMEDVRLATTRMVRGVNVLGIPALVMPCGANADGLPIGLQILGPPFQEGLLLRVGAALEDATEWHKRRPNL